MGFIVGKGQITWHTQRFAREQRAEDREKAREYWKAQSMGYRGPSERELMWGLARPASTVAPTPISIELTDSERMALHAGALTPWLRAGEFKFKFGMFSGQCIHQVAQSRRGLQYLDFMLENQVNSGKATGALGKALQTYLEDPRVAAALLTAKRSKR